MTRSVSLDTVTFKHRGMKFITVTAPEMIKSKCVAIVNRNLVWPETLKYDVPNWIFGVMFRKLQFISR